MNSQTIGARCARLSGLGSKVCIGTRQRKCDGEALLPSLLGYKKLWGAAVNAKATAAPSELNEFQTQDQSRMTGTTMSRKTADSCNIYDELGSGVVGIAVCTSARR
jgi:hypothetical protein